MSVLELLASLPALAASLRSTQALRHSTALAYFPAIIPYLSTSSPLTGDYNSLSKVLAIVSLCNCESEETQTLSHNLGLHELVPRVIVALIENPPSKATISDNPEVNDIFTKCVKQCFSVLSNMTTQSPHTPSIVSSLLTATPTLTTLVCEVQISAFLTETTKRAIMERAVALLQNSILSHPAVLLQINSDRVLTSNILRLTLPTSTSGDSEPDSLTNWIRMFLASVVATEGGFVTMWKSVDSKDELVTPEQIILLHSLYTHTDTAMGGATSHAFMTPEFLNILTTTFVGLPSYKHAVAPSLIPLIATVLGIALGATLDDGCHARITKEYPDLLATAVEYLSGDAHSEVKISCLRIITNLLHGNAEVREALPKEYIYAVLSSTNAAGLEDVTMREWAVVAIREITTNSERNRDIIKDLEKQSEGKLTPVT